MVLVDYKESKRILVGILVWVAGRHCTPLVLSYGHFLWTAASCEADADDDECSSSSRCRRAWEAATAGRDVVFIPQGMSGVWWNAALNRMVLGRITLCKTVTAVRPAG